jgi:hypothetical protein
MPISRDYFETRDIRLLRGSSWLPLRQVTDVNFDPPETSILRLREFTGIATAAVHDKKRGVAETLGWGDLDVGSHWAGVESQGYRSADTFVSYKDGSLGINLVIDQFLEGEHQHVWHLHPDIIVALRLIREGDSWFRPEEGWSEVVRLRRNDSGDPVLLEIKAEFLADYLSARGMSLYCSSYRERVAVTAKRFAFGWPEDRFDEAHGRDRREGRISDSIYPDPVGNFVTLGALWRTEWVDAGPRSIRVRGDEVSYAATFCLTPDGTRRTPDQLAGVTSWLYFEPALVATLLRHRGAQLGWYSAETGSLGATGFGIHFGVNSLGLITIFAKDVTSLAPWEQRLWSAHNVTPDGGVSKELFAAQMDLRPASTVAPENELSSALEAVDHAFAARYGSPLLRDHEMVPALLRRAHRFQAAEADGLLELAKELTRLFIERVNVDAIVAALNLPKSDRKPGSLKMIEKLVAHHLTEIEAKEIMAPLFGIYDLRLADAHLGVSLIANGKMRASIDDTAAAPMQGRQMLQSFVAAIQRVGAAVIQET